MTHRVAAALAVMAVLMAAGVILPPTAAALPLVGDCKVPPMPAPPDAGLGGWIVIPGPVPDDRNSPFDENASTGIVDHYGFGGLTWSTYDLACVDTPHTGAIEAANQLIDLGTIPPVVITSITGQLGFLLDNGGFMQAFDPLLQHLTETTVGKVLAPLFPIAVVALGVYMLITHGRSRIADTAGHVAWLLVILAVTAYFAGAPLKVAQTGDDVMAYANSKVHDLATGNGASHSVNATIEPIHHRVLYDSWLMGELGSTDSDTAKKWGSELYKNQTISRAELANTRGDPGAYKDMIKTKQNRWRDVAAEVETSDPYAYSVLKGDQVGTRLWATIGMWIGVFTTCLFLSLSFVTLVVAWFVIRFAIIGFPLVALVGVFPSKRHVLIKMGSRVGAAMLDTVIFTFTANVVAVLVGRALNVGSLPDGTAAPVWLRYVTCFVIVAVAWHFTRPFRSVVGLVAGSKAATSFAAVAGFSTRLGIQYAVMKSATRAGTRDGQDQNPDLPPPPNRKRAEAHHRPPPRTYRAGEVWERNPQTGVTDGPRVGLGAGYPDARAYHGPGQARQSGGGRRDHQRPAPPGSAPRDHQRPAGPGRRPREPVDLYPTIGEDGEVIYVAQERV